MPKASTLSTDKAGKLILPNKPNTNGWAFRIKSKPGSVSSVQTSPVKTTPAQTGLTKVWVAHWTFDEGKGTTFQDSTGIGSNYTGDLDEVRIYKRGLSDEEIAALFKHEAQATETRKRP